MKIVSGGQTGADRAALDAATKLGIPYGGWLPKGRKAEDGPLSLEYKLRELDTEDYRDRTEQNVIDSDATLIISFGPLTGGSALTEALTIKHNKPCLFLDLELISNEEGVEALETWLEKYAVETLNVAGPRASKEPRIYYAVYTLLLQINWENIQA